MNHKLVQVKDAMTTNNYEFADGMMTVAEGITLAKNNNVSALIINKRNPQDEYGLVMLADIAKEVLAKDRSPDRVNLYEIMAKPMLSVNPNMDVRYCARLFERFSIHLAPVVEDNEIIGMVDYINMVFSQAQ
ncbi:MULTISPECIES: CBS domain-containing protein [unclassified Colwellia]|jgi:predicted transcriptional regulator|uniref:CBS domain-containing protein n=1 Tax=unclassified Colwellia TaxID=196834 RepID=UPI0015F356D3|nr:MULTISPECIES: CBS domain-containing protein [unclassified Colwellia]MBA6230762.1 CBS domain-containing protein [Colwellia sp. MB02u-7]MBA6234693.1 CBS domain-containing protein [Colwellia sp. MB02u-11]MBA6255556.1 CBS domain-containing protein [Colwellia sp. MB3u-28]MBA6261696.1 CBS domain-containing protein [Colwellia sp. MB3u-41]MBA6263054.1 CBS domain-containing protein [Colwellia sp. Bg11-12]